MWLRTTAATIALAAVLSCGALIDGVKQFPGPWALVPVGAALLFILAGANLQADPTTRDNLPLPNRLMATAPLVRLGAMAYSLYLWHWPLLIFWLAYTGHAHANFVEGTAVLLISGVLAYGTNRYIEEPLRLRRAASAAKPATRAVPWRTRLRRPTIVLGSVVGLLGVTLTATAFTWREHVNVERASGKELSGLSSSDYPGAAPSSNTCECPSCGCGPRCWKPRRTTRRPPATAASATFQEHRRNQLQPTAIKTATRTIALAGGSHAEHWLTALDLLGRMHHFKVATYLKMGCPLSTEKVPFVMGNNDPYPECHDWVPKAMAKVVADHPDYVFTTSTRPWNIKPGDVMPGTYIGIWQTFSDNNIPDPCHARHPVAGQGRATVQSVGLPRQGRQLRVVWHQTCGRVG